MNTRTQFTNNGAFLGATQQRDFELPPCAPGKEWHRKDGWQESDLPQGWRPLTNGEEAKEGDEYYNSRANSWSPALYETVYNARHARVRTRRPLTFEHAGKTWTWHKPGDPMPCDGERVLQILLSNGEPNRDFAQAKFWDWESEDKESDVEIIGWRYASEKKTVPFGPGDVTPFTRLRVKVSGENHTLWIAPLCVNRNGVVIATPSSVVEVSFESLLADYERNESLSTGKWDANAWEPCHKEEVSA